MLLAITSDVLPETPDKKAKPSARVLTCAAPLSALKAAVAANTLAAKVAQAPTHPLEPLPIVSFIFEKPLAVDNCA